MANDLQIGSQKAEVFIFKFGRVVFMYIYMTYIYTNFKIDSGSKKVLKYHVNLQ